MLSRERQRQVLEHVRRHGSGQVAELAAALRVSASTVRRDLSELSERGLLTRVHGGAALAADEVEAVPGARAAENEEQKRRIGRAAADLVGEGDTVLVTGGTTTEAMLPFLASYERLTVLTNNLTVALRLATHPSADVVVLGGVLRRHEQSLLGPLAVQALAEFHVDLTFSGAFGIDAVSGLYGADVREVETDRGLLAGAGRLVVLADATKFARRGPVRLVDVARIDTLVTDVAADPAALAALRTRGIDVVTC